MIHAASDTAASMIRNMGTSIIKDGKVPVDLEESFIVCLYKGKGDALDRGNYRGLKLTEQVMKIVERILDDIIHDMVYIDDCSLAVYLVGEPQMSYLWCDSCKRNS
jgi:hypothetical protein